MWGRGGGISTSIWDSLEDCGERGGRHSDAGPRVPVPLVPPHQDRRLPGPGVTRASGLGDRRWPVPPVAVAVSGRRCVDQAGGRCVGGGVPRGGQRAHAGNGRPRRLGQETALRPAPLSVPGAGRAAGPVWLRLGRFPRCGCQGSGLFPSQPAPHRRGAQRSSSSPGSSPSSARVCGSLRHLRGKQVPRAGSRPPFPEDAGRWLSSPDCPAGPRATEEQTASPCPWSQGTRAASARTATVPFGVPRSPSPHRVPVISSSAGRFYQETLLGSDARPAQPPRPCEVLIALGSMDVVFTGFHTSSRARVPALNPARLP